MNSCLRRERIKEAMNTARRNFHVFIYVFLAFPGLVSAHGEGLIPPTSETSSAGAAPLQLAAAIGIIRSEPAVPPPVEEPAEPPVQPENPVSPPISEQPTEQAETPIASNDEEIEESEPSGISKTKIWIGVGIAALLGAVAGGGGGGSSSTSQH
jgi:hypothetical protein